MELASKYNPADVEGKWYQYWLDHHLFSSKPDGREPYTIVIPPPNVTGVLHMGHMLNNTIQDILVRRARMEGKNACWVPGTDHASIATEAKVVNKLAAQGIKKTDLTRDEFLKHAWDWTDEHGGIILKQLRKLGASCDWNRTAFTMDEKRSESVLKVFVDLFNKGLIYRGVRMVNWDPKALTALSDEEVIYKEEHGKLYYLRYKVEGDPEGRYAVVATTRPETIMGDTAMCINPNDPKNEWLKGKKVIVPLVNRAIPVIEDDYVDIEFGTGCLKVTPAHDVNDYMLGEKYNLPSIDIFNDNGTLSEAAGMYIGMDRFDVRIQIEKDLEAAGLLDKTEAYTNKVGYSERTNVVIEPKLSMQWFLKMQHFADMALPPVMNDELKFYPAKYKNTYRHWMENIKDWCISRQLWWGHRIPAYFLPEGGYVVAATAEEALAKAKEKTGNAALTIEDLRQDEDCLDTWFSSWLWPISLFDGINNPGNEEINYYYPTSDVKYRDLNDDKIIDDNDMCWTGNPTVPEIIYGFGFSLKYKGFDCSAFFQGQGKVSILMYNYHPFATAATPGSGLMQWIADEHWSEDDPNPKALYPRLSPLWNNNNTKASTLYVRNGKMLRLKTAEIGYTYKKMRV